MNFAAIDWLSISINLLLVVFVIVCLLMILLILMQRPKQEGLGAAFGAGVTDQVFGARTTNVLQRGTVYLGSLFFILSLALAVLIGHKNKNTSMLSPKTAAVVEEKTQPAKPEAEVKPKSLSEELPAEEKKPADAPASTPEITPAVQETPIPQPAPVDAPPASNTTVPAPANETAPPAETPKPADSTAPADNSGAPEEKSGEP